MMIVVVDRVIPDLYRKRLNGENTTKTIHLLLSENLG